MRTSTTGTRFWSTCWIPAYDQAELGDADARGWRKSLAGTIANTIDTLQTHPGFDAVALGTIPTLPGALWTGLRRAGRGSRRAVHRRDFSIQVVITGLEQTAGT